MAHFAEVNEKNEVVNVIFVDNDDINNTDFPISENIGREFLKKHIETNNIFYQTSYNRNFRGNYGETGSYYDQKLDEFILPYEFKIIPDIGDIGPQTSDTR
jgi:hypothetical protein